MPAVFLYSVYVSVHTCVCILQWIIGTLWAGTLDEEMRELLGGDRALSDPIDDLYLDPASEWFNTEQVGSEHSISDLYTNLQPKTCASLRADKNLKQLISRFFFLRLKIGGKYFWNTDDDGDYELIDNVY